MSRDKTSLVSPDTTSLVPRDKTSLVSQDKTSLVSQDNTPPGIKGRKVLKLAGSRIPTQVIKLFPEFPSKVRVPERASIGKVSKCCPCAAQVIKVRSSRKLKFVCGALKGY